MATMDVFNSDAFSLVALTTAVNKIDYKPQLLSRMGIFTPRRVRTEKVAVELRDQTLSLVQTSRRGAPLDQQANIKSDIKDFRTVRIAKGDRIMSDEIQGIRAFGTESEFKQIQTEIAERQARLLDDIDLTKENMLLGAVQGVLADADGSTIYNWFTELDVSQAGEIDFDLDNATPASGALIKKCDQVVTQMRQASKGAFIGGARAIGLCGTAFWRDLIAHAEIQKLWELQTLYGDQTGLASLLGLPANDLIEYGGITFIRYWGTDDDSTVAIGTNECKFFPMGARDAFEIAYAPMENYTYANTPGKDFYSMIIPDRDRMMWVDVEVYSYPLPICTRPAMLQRAKRT